MKASLCLGWLLTFGVSLSAADGVDAKAFQRRMAWLNTAMPRAENVDRSQSEFLDELQKSSREAGVKLEEQALRKPLACERYTEAAITFKCRGDQTAMLKWLMTLQSIDKFVVIKELDLAIDTAGKPPAQAVCNLTVARWFNTAANQSAGTLASADRNLDFDLVWKTFDPAINPEHYPAVLLAHVCRAMPQTGLLMTRYHTSDQGIELTTNIHHDQIGSQFVTSLRDELKRFSWTQVVQDLNAEPKTLKIQGKLK